MEEEHHEEEEHHLEEKHHEEEEGEHHEEEHYSDWCLEWRQAEEDSPYWTVCKALCASGSNPHSFPGLPPLSAPLATPLSFQWSVDKQLWSFPHLGL